MPIEMIKESVESQDRSSINDQKSPTNPQSKIAKSLIEQLAID
jgi:hypothetical protein